MTADQPLAHVRGGETPPLWADIRALELLTHKRKTPATNEHRHGPQGPRAHL